MNEGGDGGDPLGAPARAAAWLWAAGYAVLAVPFVPLWPDFETARRGLGNVIGGLGLLALAWSRRRSTMPATVLLLWLGVVALHALSLLAPAARSGMVPNPADGLARTLWLVSLGGIAMLAAQTHSLLSHLGAMTWTGAAVAAFGLAQALGWPWPHGYSTPGDAVSTLGNRNVAAEFCTLATVAAAIVLLRAPRALWPALAVVLGVGYLWVNHSRSGLLAASFTLVPLLLAPWRHHPGQRRLLLLGMVLVGLGGGQLIRSTQALPPPSGPALAASDGEPAPNGPLSTVAVRVELWTSGLRMIGDAPWLGVGAAHFKVHYPRYRSQREIELSTRGRTFAAAPMTAHNDPLEVAIETGVLGLLLYLAFWVAIVQRRRRGGAVGLLPVAAFLILGLVRSPLGNAPAAAFAFACVGTLCATRRQAPAAPSLLWRAGGTALAALVLWMGARECAGQCAVVPHLREHRKPDPAQHATLVQMHALDRAVGWCPWDTQLRAMRSWLRFALAQPRNDLAAVRALVAPGGDVEVLLRQDPFDSTNLLRAASAYQALGDGAATAGLLRRILDLDPPNPEARLFLATEQALAGDAAAAVATLYADGHPHPRLRQGLATFLRDLAQRAPDAAARALLARESAFVTAVDGLLAQPAPAATAAAVRAFAQLAARDDFRAVLLLAAALLQQGDRDGAAAAAAGLPEARLDPTHTELLREVLERLRALPSWDDRLRR